MTMVMVTKPLLNRAAVPLRMIELLHTPEATLDRRADRRYPSAMKDFDDGNGAATSDQECVVATRLRAGGVDGEASLYSFLAVAEILYERIATALGRAGLSYAKYEILEHLRTAGEPVSLGALAEGQGCARSNITQLVDRLEGEGLVRRVDDPSDRRSVRAELTDLGREQVAEGATQIDVVRAQFTASLTAAERRELARLLAKLG